MSAEQLKGHLDALLLAVLEAEALHGYAIIEALKARSAGTFDLPGGTIYPALRRLELAGLVEGTWSEVAGRRRRTYRLTVWARGARRRARRLAQLRARRGRGTGIADTMAQRETAPIERYLADLAAVMPPGGTARELLDEVRDHLHEATDAREAAGADRDTAAREAAREFGGGAALAAQFRAAVVVGDARRQAVRQLAGGALLLADGFGALHLLDGALGQPDAQPAPALAHAAALAALGPAFLLLWCSRAAWPWRDARRLAWLDGLRALASWLFQPGVVACAVLLASLATRLTGAPHHWAAVTALGSHIIACALVPIAGAAHLPRIFTRGR